MAGVLLRGEFRHEHTETQGRTLCDDRGKDWGDLSKNQEASKIAGRHQKPGEIHGRILP